MGKNNDVGYALTRGQGFQITFENGVTLSVQFGPGNYCNNRDKIDIVKFYTEKVMRGESDLGCPNAEIAVLVRGRFITNDVMKKAGLDGLGGDDVAGWISPDNLAKIMAVCVGMKVM